MVDAMFQGIDVQGGSLFESLYKWHRMLSEMRKVGRLSCSLGTVEGVRGQLSEGFGLHLQFRLICQYRENDVDARYPIFHCRAQYTLCPRSESAATRDWRRGRPQRY